MSPQPPENTHCKRHFAPLAAECGVRSKEGLNKSTNHALVR